MVKSGMYAWDPAKSLWVHFTEIEGSWTRILLLDNHTTSGMYNVCIKNHDFVEALENGHVLDESEPTGDNSSVARQETRRRYVDTYFP